MSQIYAIASGKGGVGKSTLTSNLGATLSQDGAKVIIVDADIGLRSQDALLGMENRIVYDLIDLASGECLLDQAILPCEGLPSLFLLPAAQFARAKALDPKKLRNILRSLRYGYDYILIDCPAGIERGLRNVLNAGVDEVILVATPDDLSLRSAGRVVQIMEEKQQQRPQLVINRTSEALIRSGEMMTPQTASQVIDLPLLGDVPEDPAVYRAQLNHSLFIRYDCPARGAIQRIAGRLKGQTVPFPQHVTPNTRRAAIRKRLARILPSRKKLKEVTALDDH